MAAKVIQSSSEVEAIQQKLTESLTTARRLHLQTKKLEEENKTLKDGAHIFANTKLVKVERENALLQAKAKEQGETITKLESKLYVLSEQKVACEDQNRSLTEVNNELKAMNSHLEQKVIGQQASIQNCLQVCYGHVLCCDIVVHVHVHTYAAHMYVPYSRKYWQELSLAIGPLQEYEVWYRITIRIYMSNKY